MRLHERTKTENETEVVACNRTAFESEEALENQLNRNPQLLLDVTGNQTYRVITRKWKIEGADDLDENLRDEIADSFATLVRLGHEAFADSQGRDS